jgi:hypothetical protein
MPPLHSPKTDSACMLRVPARQLDVHRTTNSAFCREVRPPSTFGAAIHTRKPDQ